MGLLPNLCQSINLSITIRYLPFYQLFSIYCHQLFAILSIAISYLYVDQIGELPKTITEDPGTAGRYR